MSYLYQRVAVGSSFAILPIFDPSDGFDSGGFDIKPQTSPSGRAYWPHGARRAPRGPRTAPRRGQYIEASEAAIWLKYTALSALAGQEARIYRLTELRDLQWIRGAVDIKPENRTPTPGGIYRYRNEWTLTVDCTFTFLDPTWHGYAHGGGWAFDSGVSFDTGRHFDEADTIVLANGATTAHLRNSGNAPVNDAILMFPAAASSPINSIHFVGGGADWTWTGTVAAGQSLVIDTRVKSVLNNGVDAWGGLVFNSGHSIDSWIEIAQAPITALQLPAAAAATTLDVFSAAGIANGATIQVLLDDGTLHKTTVNGTPVGTVVTLTDALPSSADATNTVLVDGTTDVTITAVIGGSHTAASLVPVYDDSWI